MQPSCWLPRKVSGEAGSKVWVNLSHPRIIPQSLCGWTTTATCIFPHTLPIPFSHSCAPFPICVLMRTASSAFLNLPPHRSHWSPQPISSHLLACRPGNYSFLPVSPLTLDVGNWQETASSNVCDLVNVATRTAGIGIAKGCGCFLLAALLNDGIAIVSQGALVWKPLTKTW